MISKSEENWEILMGAAAKAFIFYGGELRDIAKNMSLFLDSEIPITYWQILSRGGKKSIISRISMGNLGIDEELGIWNSGFLNGLRDSGCFYEIEYSRYLLYYKKHIELVEDFRGIKIPINVSISPKTLLTGIYFPLFLYPSEKNNSKEYIAGLLAGGEIVMDNGYEWIKLKNRKRSDFIDYEGRKSALSSWGIVSKEVKGGILISPFYGAIFSGYMPLNIASRILGIRKSGMSPEIGIVYWNVAMKSEHERIFPLRMDEVPYVSGYATNWRNGRNYGDFRKKGVEMGIVSVPLKLREVMMEWVSWHQLNRGFKKI